MVNYQPILKVLLVKYFKLGTNDDLKCMYQQRFLLFPCPPNKLFFSLHYRQGNGKDNLLAAVSGTSSTHS